MKRKMASIVLVAVLMSCVFLISGCVQSDRTAGNAIAKPNVTQEEFVSDLNDLKGLMDEIEHSFR